VRAAVGVVRAPLDQTSHLERGQLTGDAALVQPEGGGQVGESLRTFVVQGGEQGVPGALDRRGVVGQTYGQRATQQSGEGALEARADIRMRALCSLHVRTNYRGSVAIPVT
jgi:hypothetical protein